MTSFYADNGPRKFYREFETFHELMDDLLNFMCDCSDTFFHALRDCDDLYELITTLKRYGYKVTIELI